MDYFERVKELARAKNTTIEAVANAAGLTRASYNSYRGKGNLPRADEAYKMATALETSVEYLVTGAEPEILGAIDKAVLGRARKYNDVFRDYDILGDEEKRVLGDAIRAAASRIREREERQRILAAREAEKAEKRSVEHQAVEIKKAAEKRGRLKIAKPGQNDA